MKELKNQKESFLKTLYSNSYQSSVHWIGTQIKKEIKEFRRKLANKINEAENKDRVYCLSVQFFPLDKKGVTYGS